jgi:hypothetical protein
MAAKEDDTPKYAYFDSQGKAASPDDLPEMPSWEGAKEERVVNPKATNDAVEMTNVNNAKYREGNNHSPASASRQDNGYGRPRSPYEAQHPGYGQFDDGYGRQSPAPQYSQNGYPNNNYNNQPPQQQSNWHVPGHGQGGNGGYGGNQYDQQQQHGGRHTPMSNNGGYQQSGYGDGYQQSQGGYFQHQPPYANQQHPPPSPGGHPQARHWTNV